MLGIRRTIDVGWICRGPQLVVSHCTRGNDMKYEMISKRYEITEKDNREICRMVNREEEKIATKLE